MKFFLVFVSFLSFILADTLIQGHREYPIDKLKEQNKKVIKMVVSEISKNLPQKVDKYTTLVNIKDENLTLVYTFEIDAKPKSDEAIIREDKDRMQKAITKGICQTSQRFLKSDINLAYKYKSASTKKELFTFYITKESCKEYEKN